MLKIVRIRVHAAQKVGVLYHCKNQTFRDGSQHGIVYRDFEPLEYVKVLSSTLVKLYLAIIPLLRA